MGKFDKNPKLKDHFEVVSESVINTVFSFIPAGPIFDSFWNYRANLKQKRVIDFSDSVKNILEEIGGNELHSSNFETEDFVDIMEAVYMRVMNTQSLYKVERFRNILAKQIISPNEFHETQKFIQILDSLQDIDLVILDKMRNNDKMQYVSNFHKLLIGDDGPYEADYPVTINAGGVEIYITAGDIEFYVNRLISIGLFKLLTGIQMTSSNGKTKKYSTIIISKMGKKFLKFIELNGSIS